MFVYTFRLKNIIKTKITQKKSFYSTSLK